MDVKDIARQVDVDPHWLEKELETVKERYLWDAQWMNEQLTNAEMRDHFRDLHNAAQQLDQLITRSKNMFLKPTLQNHWEPDCSTEDLISMLRGIQKLTGENVCNTQPSTTRRNKRHPGVLLSLLKEAWYNLTGERADSSTRFQNFLYSSCDYMGLASTGLWDRHRHKKRYDK